MIIICKIYITFKLFIDWYSSGVYYTTETITDIIPTTISACFVTVLTFYIQNQLNESKRFWTNFYSNLLNLHTMEGFGHLVAIILFRNKVICFMLGVLYSISGCIFRIYTRKSMINTIKLLFVYSMIIYILSNDFDKIVSIIS